ncbi:MAG: methyltransferase domain-containing protein [Bryobacteraceae bacterium]|jgi:ubiquinone/menaquinone biosynthesis C-methylase UbiE
MGNFDAVAARYDGLWTHTAIGRLQRDAVWRRVDPLLRPGDSVLDLGCGTGEDALHLTSMGMRVHAIDASAEMVRIARSRGIDATLLVIEEIGQVPGCFDAVISNFGALNCLEDLSAIRAPLARLVRPGGHLAICVMGRFCLWETAWYVAKAQPRKAFRRWNRRPVASSIGVRVSYPSIRQLRQAFQQDFRLVEWYGVGIAVPPSYVAGLAGRTLARLAAFDRRVECLPLWRALSDHRLLILRRT